MEQAVNKKNKKWIWLLAGIGLLAALAVAAVLVFQPKPQAEPPAAQETPTSPLYWNVDQKQFTENSETGLSTREPAEDGLYHVRFLLEGQLVEYTVADVQLVNYIDTMQVLGLVLDDSGFITDAISPKDIAVEVGRDLYVRKFDGENLSLNSSVAMNGMTFELKITPETGIYEVFKGADRFGKTGTPAPMDTVTVYEDRDGNVTHVFLTEKSKPSDIYWRVGSFWDNVSSTTRVPDENGVYTLLFAHKGQQVELKCKDKAVVDQIDKQLSNSAACGLVLDEDGYIAEYVLPSMGIRGIELCNNANITELREDYFAATRYLIGNEQGRSYEVTFGDGVEIYLVCDGGTAESFIGEPTQLRPTDRITCYTDLDGQVKLIYVTRRMSDSPMYFNLSRQYISSQKRTERKPDKSGWYTFEMAVEGKVKTVKTKSLDIANQIDSYSTRAMGLKLKGSVVEKVYHADTVCGWTTAVNGRYVTAISNTILSAAHPGDFEDFANFVTNDGCEVYDVSGAYGTTGKKTQVREGDEIIAFRDTAGNLTHVYVTGRYQKGTKIYYNTARRYNSSTGETTRQPDAEGYYVYEMVCEGKTVTVKTKSKDLASYIDKQNAPFIAMKVSGGTVKNAYPMTAAVRYSTKTANFHYVASLADGKLKTYYISDGERRENPTGYTVASDCVIYNVSEGYVNQRGEKSKLKKDDRIQAMVTNPRGQITMIFIMERKIESSLYWNKKPMYKNGETTRQPDAEGYYIYELAVKGAVRTLKTKDKALADKLDSYTTAMGLLLDGDIIKQVYPTSTVKGIKSLSVGRYDVMEIDGKTVTFRRNRPTSDNYGDVQKVKMTSGCKVYDVSPYAESFGAAVELQLGDRVAGYTNEDGKLVYAYIVNRNTHKAGHISHCDHCDQEVFWEPYTTEIVSADAHYYLPCDTAIASRLNIGRADDENRYDVVFDLNGFTLSCTRQAFLVCDQLSLVDTAGTGKIVVGSSGGIMVSGGLLQLYSGTVTVGEGFTPGNGGLVYLASNAAFTMYGGILTGGQAMEKGGNVLITSTATFTMEGGEITGGTAAQGGNIHATGRMCLRGGSITNGETYVAQTQTTVLTGRPIVELLTVETGKLLILDALEEGTAIGLNADGVFTAANENAESYVNYFAPINEEQTIYPVDGSLCCSVVMLPEVEAGAKISAAANAMVFPADGGDFVADCPACGAVQVTWKAIKGNNRVGYNTAGHFYCKDITQNPHTQFIGIDTAITVCLHLNGESLRNVGRIAVTGGDGKINIMGSGSVTGLGTTSGDYKQGVLVVQNKGTINLYGGTYRSELADMPVAYLQHADSVLNLYTGAVMDSSVGHNVDVINGKLNVCGGDIRGGTSAGSGGNIRVRSLYGVVTMYGGSISGGTSTAANAGGNVYLTGNSRFEMFGGKIYGGTATNGAGGNINIYKGSFILHDGKIYGGTAATDPNVCVSSENGSFTQLGGSVEQPEE